jgi:hypothetical protein
VDSHAIILVIDSTDRARIDIAKEELDVVLQSDSLKSGILASMTRTRRVCIQER